MALKNIKPFDGSPEKLKPFLEELRDYGRITFAGHVRNGNEEEVDRLMVALLRTNVTPAVRATFDNIKRPAPSAAAAGGVKKEQKLFSLFDDDEDDLSFKDYVKHLKITYQENPNHKAFSSFMDIHRLNQENMSVKEYLIHARHVFGALTKHAGLDVLSTNGGRIATYCLIAGLADKGLAQRIINLANTDYDFVEDKLRELSSDDLQCLADPLSMPSAYYTNKPKPTTTTGGQQDQQKRKGPSAWPCRHCGATDHKLWDCPKKPESDKADKTEKPRASLAVPQLTKKPETSGKPRVSFAASEPIDDEPDCIMLAVPFGLAGSGAATATTRSTSPASAFQMSDAPNLPPVPLILFDTGAAAKLISRGSIHHHCLDIVETPLDPPRRLVSASGSFTVNSVATIACLVQDKSGKLQPWKFKDVCILESPTISPLLLGTDLLNAGEGFMNFKTGVYELKLSNGHQRSIQFERAKSGLLYAHMPQAGKQYGPTSFTSIRMFDSRAVYSVDVDRCNKITEIPPAADKSSRMHLPLIREESTTVKPTVRAVHRFTFPAFQHPLRLLNNYNNSFGCGAAFARNNGPSG